MTYRVFISYKHTTMDGKSVTRDYTIASELHNALTRAGVPTFFSEKDLSTGDYINEIYRALDEAKILIVVGTRPEHIDSQWVREEWSTFIAAINGRRKPDGDVYTYLEGMSVNDLPMMLYKRQSYTTGEKEKLVKRITVQLGIKPHETIASSPKPASRPAQQMPSAPRLNVQVGSKLSFGQYPQGAGGEVQPLIWRVLAVENGRALLITDKLIDAKPYHNKLTRITWETCTLRQWMNTEFIHEAFSSSQQAQIAAVTNQNPDNPRDGTKGGKATQDMIFALSIDEAERYFRGDDDRMAAPTSYAIKKGAWTSEKYSLSSGEKTGCWWLRSPGNYSNDAAGVNYDGIISQYGNYVNFDQVAVRPAFWLNL